VTVKINGDFVNVLIQGDPKILQIWLSDPSHQDQINTHIVDGKTALSTAAMFAINSKSHWERNLRLQCVRLLLDKGADVHQFNEDGSSCFDLAIQTLEDDHHHQHQVPLDKTSRNQISHLLDCLKFGRRERVFKLNHLKNMKNIKLCDSAFITNLTRSD